MRIHDPCHPGLLLCLASATVVLSLLWRII